MQREAASKDQEAAQLKAGLEEASERLARMNVGQDNLGVLLTRAALDKDQVCSVLCCALRVPAAPASRDQDSGVF